ncbi:MAG: hypothetical protein U5J95_12410 [Balneolaceae bacterium]|nr:hypothetical protein [Balneolaceae bacterium]
MIRKLGSLLIFGGFIALIYTAYNYFNNMESFEFLGTDFVISKGRSKPEWLLPAVY